MNEKFRSKGQKRTCIEDMLDEQITTLHSDLVMQLLPPLATLEIHWLLGRAARSYLR
jgi:hypothetical protein